MSANIIFFPALSKLSSQHTETNDSHLPLKTTKTIIKHCRQPFMVKRPLVSLAALAQLSFVGSANSFRFLRHKLGLNSFHLFRRSRHQHRQITHEKLFPIDAKQPHVNNYH